MPIGRASNTLGQDDPGAMHLSPLCVSSHVTEAVWGRRPLGSMHPSPSSSSEPFCWYVLRFSFQVRYVSNLLVSHVLLYRRLVRHHDQKEKGKASSTFVLPNTFVAHATQRGDMANGGSDGEPSPTSRRFGGPAAWCRRMGGDLRDAGSFSASDSLCTSLLRQLVTVLG